MFLIFVGRAMGPSEDVAEGSGGGLERVMGARKARMEMGTSEKGGVEKINKVGIYYSAHFLALA